MDLPRVKASIGMYRQMGLTTSTETLLNRVIRSANQDQNLKRSNLIVFIYLIFLSAGTRWKYTGNADDVTLPQ
ncbi:hypothetical protein [Methanospirillum lacunae]|uniref:Uncharacterized protein n=1 Tax=Methanospirillum lacunae TaxID=668570 RepID=A0A2V2MRJ6_9EURY|nr:hypothetical protein [Methanospirillum lacunae]PWR70009.1 hypothetical protein DK846_16405 [Methanospirillum lacunae]